MKTSIKVISTVVALGLAGCQAHRQQAAAENANLPDNKRESIGTAIGIAAGAAAGALTGNNDTRGRNAAIGAVVGGVAGNRIGAHMDTKERELRAATAGSGIQVKRNGNQIDLVMPGDITFATGAATIQPSFTQALERVGKVLKDDAEIGVNVKGYTDSTGAAAFNQSLSERRARAVGDYLAAEGVAKDRLRVQGFGKDNPIAANTDAAGRAKNRRVEMQLFPIAH